MSNEHQSLLRFSVEESIWFQKGQEVEELFSLSLDPQVTVEDMDQYVIIKGELTLAGEYRREESDRQDEVNFSFVSPKTISRFVEREQGVFEFQHSFPVDITIPANRIESLEDVSVAISSFDYSMPERNCLSLCAELMISGIYGEQQTLPEHMAPEYLTPSEPELMYRGTAVEDAEAEAEADSGFYESSISFPSPQDLYSPFEVEAKKLPQEEEEAEAPLFENQHSDFFAPPAFPEYDEPEVPEAVRVEAAEAVEEAAEEEETEVPLFFSGQEAGEDAEEIVPQAGDDAAPFQAAAEPAEQEQNSGPVLAPREMEDAPVPRSLGNAGSGKEYRRRRDAKEQEQAEPAPRQSVSLTDFFGRKEEQEHTRVKVCLVQQGDTLNALASRYEISASAIAALNELDATNEISEGQVLYIPSKPTLPKR
ncbi:stage VI sporulation protein D [Peribacillus sp. SCS-37]|uniref:stage VI sporulation protein D n=1 Tax=Paraperibacillus esterisolvens TaxID=3115296 RepID=UPI003906D3D5